MTLFEATAVVVVDFVVFVVVDVVFVNVDVVTLFVVTEHILFSCGQ